MEIKKQLLPKSQRKPKPADEKSLGFGRILTDHMFLLDYVEGKGWHDARIVPYGPLHLDPAALVLHYGQEVFEGLKAYRTQNGAIHLFRPQGNVERLLSSCQRMCIPEPPADFILEAIAELVRTEKDWIPSSPGTSLYIRPTVIASEAALGVQISKEYIFFIIVGPVGAYYPEGFNPTKIYVEEKYVRASAGGTGAAKTSANYANSLLAFKEAHDAGYTQVLWLDACDRKTVEEVGTSNMFFVIGGEVITAPLGGTILPGVTRDSALKLCEHWGIKASERRITIDEVIAAQKDGSLKEAFGAGTAAVISPVGQFAYRGREYEVGGGKTGPISRRLYDEIMGIQYGSRPDPFNWVVKIA
jgi:branched-chain amino acid aminotransferase